ncbi:hypothetical protein COLSTE_00019 [Collinsella stercoris DSM 13279]|uniref:Uncharacterized protein n=1 Tax=Collinsella stercoris DSM 13279 TaxID=445975 RepID=B6G7I0_9ACTN|nr:hypothetical protein COLSTE_00019 [Collinsella stercoris DSM 13279]
MGRIEATERSFKRLSSPRRCGPFLMGAGRTERGAPAARAALHCQDVEPPLVPEHDKERHGRT